MQLEIFEEPAATIDLVAGTRPGLYRYGEELYEVATHREWIKGGFADYWHQRTGLSWYKPADCPAGISWHIYELLPHRIAVCRALLCEPDTSRELRLPCGFRLLQLHEKIGMPHAFQVDPVVFEREVVETLHQTCQQPLSGRVCFWNSSHEPIRYLALPTVPCGLLYTYGEHRVNVLDFALRPHDSSSWSMEDVASKLVTYDDEQLADHLCFYNPEVDERATV